METITLTDQHGCPTFTILRGHHDIKTFNAAFKEEGWDADPWIEECISHEYWIHDISGVWVCSNKQDPQSQPVTVAPWDLDGDPDSSLH